MDSIFIPALQQSVLLLPLCLGIYITYCIMRITDLTVEGSFVLGAAVFARLISHGHGQIEALVCAIMAAAAVGIGVASISRLAKLDPLITSILAVFMLYSINFKIMGRPNISLLSYTDFMQQIMSFHTGPMLGVLLAITALFSILALLLLKSNFGLLLRVYGDNKSLLAQLSQHKFLIFCLGLVLSNALAGISGVLVAQANGYADINMGLGTALTAIGSIILGLNIMRQLRPRLVSYHALTDICGCVLGIVIYFVAMNALLYFGVDPMYMKLALGICLMCFLSSYHLNKKRAAYA